MATANILVVDDEAFFRQLYAELLHDVDYQVETASSGEEALGRLRQGGIDVLLTDMVMPGIDGMELLREARNIENPPDVILVTGHATVETAIQALKSGARDYLVKPFNPNELLHLVRTCLEQRRLLDENIILKNQIRLYRAGQFLASLLDVDSLLDQVLETALREIGGGRGFAFLSENGERKLVCARRGIVDDAALELIGPLTPHLSDLSGLRQLSAADVPGHAVEDLRELFIYPLTCQEGGRGGVVLFNPLQGDFLKPVPLKNLLFLLEQASLGFDNAYRYWGARELMYTDDLTGLYNYRYLHKALDQEFARGIRYGDNFSLVFIDLDHFKEVNDTYGHLIGSNTLKVIADLLRLCVREVDTLFRYGGDEFTVILAETDKKGVAVVAERFRQTIADHLFEFDGGISFHLTATLGHATFPEDATDKEVLIDLADQAMYVGKEHRNVTRAVKDIPGR